MKGKNQKINSKYQDEGCYGEKKNTADFVMVFLAPPPQKWVSQLQPISHFYKMLELWL
jgi:hypothetical protein